MSGPARVAVFEERQALCHETRRSHFRRPEAGPTPKTRVRVADKQKESAPSTAYKLFNSTTTPALTTPIVRDKSCLHERKNNMAPTEATILTNYLLVPAQLPAIISLKEFTELFPRAQQSSPQIRKLYRDLQNQRNAVIDEVASNIETEAKRGKALRREVLRAKREAEHQEGDDEIDLERAVSTMLSSSTARRCKGAIYEALAPAMRSLRTEARPGADINQELQAKPHVCLEP